MQTRTDNQTDPARSDELREEVEQTFAMSCFASSADRSQALMDELVRLRALQRPIDEPLHAQAQQSVRLWMEGHGVRLSDGALASLVQLVASTKAVP